MCGHDQKSQGAVAVAARLLELVAQKKVDNPRKTKITQDLLMLWSMRICDVLIVVGVCLVVAIPNGKLFFPLEPSEPVPVPGFDLEISSSHDLGPEAEAVLLCQGQVLPDVLQGLSEVTLVGVADEGAMDA